MDRIKDLNIVKFRGINDVSIKNCGDINIILGDNNCGKTSILEAINLLKNNSVYGIFDILRIRDAIFNIQNFSYIFPYKQNSIEINAKFYEQSVNLNISYERSKIIFDKQTFLSDVPEDIKDIYSRFIDLSGRDGKEEEKIDCFVKYNGEEKHYSFIGYDIVAGRIKHNNSDNFNIVTQSAFDHFKGSLEIFPDILSDSNIHNLVVQVLKMFDEDIVDFLLINDKNHINDTNVYIKKENYDPMPLSLFGDGLKKVILLASLLVKSRDGILLIDEIETSINRYYYDDVIAFMIRTAKILNVQLFITTHNNELISRFIKTSKKYSNDDDYINLYTIRNKKNKTYSRLLSGDEAYNYLVTEENEVTR